MLELLICSVFTILPDYLYRHYAQGKRLGHEITLYSVWYELRWGITACIMLTVALIAVIFYNHPTTTNATAYFRTIPLIPETNGRVAEVYVGFSDQVKKGQPIFRLDGERQQAALDLASRQIAEIDAQMVMASSDIVAASGQIQQALGALKQAIDELETKIELNRRNDSVVSAREIERLETVVDTRRGAVVAAEAAKKAAETKLNVLLPASRATAEAARRQAEVELEKLVFRAGVDGSVEQFTLKPGDFVNPMLRPGGVLIPTGEKQIKLAAGFNQIEGQVLKVGMTAEVTCISKPWVIIPMVVTEVQDYIAAGQVRTSDQLLDALQVRQPGTITATLEPMFAGGLDGVVPGSSCMANAYTSNHDLLERDDIGFGAWLYYHVVDTVSVVHAIILRIHALLLPIQMLVLGGH